MDELDYIVAKSLLDTCAHKINHTVNESKTQCCYYPITF